MNRVLSSPMDQRLILATYIDRPLGPELIVHAIKNLAFFSSDHRNNAKYFFTIRI